MKRLFLLVALTIAAYVAVLICVVGCANMGSGPDGGPFDETPPRIVSMTPPSQVASASKTKGRKKHPSTKFSLTFSELVTIDNPTENVIVSPPQIEMPVIQAVGKKINVELLDSLKPATTYTVDFSDAIKDNNEGNPLGHFTYIFSTGEVTDTMEMSGYVLNAEDLEPISGILVGLHPAPADSTDDFDALWRTDTLFTTTPFDRVARTDGDGYFSIKGVRDGQQYLAYALKDGDADFTFSMRSEQVAFQPRRLTPGAFPDTRYDTVWVDSTHYDSIRTIPFTHFTPDDITLLAFQEANQPRMFLKSDRSDLYNFKTWFTAPSKHVPVIRGLNFNAEGAFVEQRSIGNDTIVYWLRDTLLMQQDTLTFCYDFMAWDDSLQIHALTTDTLELVSRTPWEKRLEAKRKADEKWQKQLERRHKRGDYSQETPPVENMALKCSANGSLAPNDNVLFTFDHPIDTIDLNGIHLILAEEKDTLEADFDLEEVEHNILARRLRAEWRPEQQYILNVDSAAIRTIYGTVNKPLNAKFAIDDLERFGTYFVTITDLPATKSVVLSTRDVPTADILTVDSTLIDSTLIDSTLIDSTLVADLNPEPLLTDTTFVDAPVIVQLLDRSGKVVYSVEGVRLSETSVRGEFYYLKEGEYFLRCIVDADGDGKWSPGLWAERRQPEDVFYQREKVAVRTGWDVNADWNVNAVARHLQKPTELVKQKKRDKNSTSAHERNIKRLEDRKKGAQQGSKSSTLGNVRF